MIKYGSFLKNLTFFPPNTIRSLLDMKSCVRTVSCKERGCYIHYSSHKFHCQIWSKYYW